VLTDQQAAVAAIQSQDGYNWGYDPVHYMTPEGSYAIHPDQRVREYRTMVQGLPKLLSGRK
jgi:pullulanase